MTESSYYYLQAAAELGDGQTVSGYIRDLIKEDMEKHPAIKKKVGL